MGAWVLYGLGTENQDLPGFTSFIGSWIYKGKKTFLVDVGPAATIPVLVKSLEVLEVSHLDAILLTHIHIDHAGGIGDLSLLFPDTPIVCHETGIQHLPIDVPLPTVVISVTKRPQEVGQQ